MVCALTSERFPKERARSLVRDFGVNRVGLRSTVCIPPCTGTIFFNTCRNMFLDGGRGGGGGGGVKTSSRINCLYRGDHIPAGAHARGWTIRPEKSTSLSLSNSPAVDGVRATAFNYAVLHGCDSTLRHRLLAPLQVACVPLSRIAPRGEKSLLRKNRNGLALG